MFPTRSTDGKRVKLPSDRRKFFVEVAEGGAAPICYHYHILDAAPVAVGKTDARLNGEGHAGH